ncbi:MAG: hypothetical protein JEZ08_00155 [Clostridiales bacterium]|nr:hypothetical protein [Clostridiales bacterium]
MKGHWKLILLFVILTLLIVFFTIRETSLENELNSQKLENENIKNELALMKILNTELHTYKIQANELSIELDSANNLLKVIEKMIDNSREMELTDSSLFRLFADYYLDSFISETVLATNKGGFFLDKENIYDFIVTDDNKIIAVLFFDMIRPDNQYLVLFDHSGNEQFKYSIKDFFDEKHSTYYTGDEVIKFYGYSNNNKYLWGGLGHELDIGLHFSLEVNTGELKIYSQNNWDEYHELFDKFPYER